ncbi:MAG: ATP-grasp domain-containing protein [Candidatus Thorarchaeota archaeon]|jgi:predicted ATP-grasp superfamily ATP-dependent carboligase
MNQAKSLLKDRKIGIIGFNARPLACSSNRAGADVYVSDYWGDEDLNACATNAVSVLDPKPGLRQREVHERPAFIHLVENFLTTFLKEKFDHIFIGSGFDDHTDSLMPIEAQWKITGNSTMAMKRARDWEFVAKLSDDVGFLVPQRKFADSHETVAEICSEFEFPCVIRGLRSGGGSGIALTREEKDIPKAFRKASIRGRTSLVIVQEYIRGIDVSSSVLSTGDDAHTLSVQGQLIGMPSAGRYSDFVYSGNYISNWIVI